MHTPHDFPANAKHKLYSEFRAAVVLFFHTSCGHELKLRSDRAHGTRAP